MEARNEQLATSQPVNESNRDESRQHVDCMAHQGVRVIDVNNKSEMHKADQGVLYC